MKLRLNLFKENKDVVGLAIGDQHVRALQLQGNSSSATLAGWAETPLAKTVFDADGKVDVEGLARILENLFLKPAGGRFTTKDVAINLPEARCFVRVIHVTAMSDSEIDAAVPFEAESYIPVPIDQVYLDWQRIAPTDNRIALLLVASPKTFVDSVLSAVHQAGLMPVAVEVESQGLTRALLAPGVTGGVLVADMKGAGTDLVMIEHGDIQFTSSVPVAGNSVTEAIAKGLEVPLKKAEEIKQAVGFGSTEEYPNLKTLLVPVMESLVTEIKQVMTFHDQHSQEKIGKLLLVGGSGRLKGLPEFLRSSLSATYPDLLVETGDPTVNVHMTLPPELSNGAVLPYAAAIGLAMKGLEV
jgi:type IV pilus assembly protein PilM